eukprot:11372964-Ditylum_brightwellii.AAC.1
MAPSLKPPSATTASNTHKTTANDDNNAIANNSIKAHGINMVDSSYTGSVSQQLFTTYLNLPSMGFPPLSCHR